MCRKSVVEMARVRELSAIVIDENGDAELLARQLTELNVRIVAVAKTILDGPGLLTEHGPHIVFIAVQPGREFAGFQMGNMAIEGGAHVVFVTEEFQAAGVEAMIAAVPKARVMTSPFLPEDVIAIVSNCMD